MPNITPITNDAELLNAMSKDFKPIVDEMAEWLLKKIQEIIEKNVYEPYSPGRYERLGYNGGFLGAWYKNAVRFISSYMGLGSLETSVCFEPSFLDINPEKHQHSNLAGEDRRENLAEYIESGSEYDFGGSAAVPRPFWFLVEQIIESGELDWQIEMKMLEHGISFIRM